MPNQRPRIRLQLVQRLYSFGLRAQNISRLLNWSRASIEQDVRQLIAIKKITRNTSRPDSQSSYARALKYYLENLWGVKIHPMDDYNSQLKFALDGYLGLNAARAAVFGYLSHAYKSGSWALAEPDIEYAPLLKEIIARVQDAHGIHEDYQSAIDQFMSSAEDADEAIASQTNSYFQAAMRGIKNQEFPTPRRQSELQSLLIKNLQADYENPQVMVVNWPAGQLKNILQSMLDELTRPQGQVIKMLHGIGGPRLNGEQIASRYLHVSRERVRQLKEQAFRILTCQMNWQKLQDIFCTPEILQRRIVRLSADLENEAYFRQVYHQQMQILRGNSGASMVRVNYADQCKLDMRIAELPLKPRALRAMQKLNIQYVRELVRCTPEQLLKVKYFGPKSLGQVSQILKKMGLDFGIMPLPRLWPSAEQTLN